MKINPIGIIIPILFVAALELISVTAPMLLTHHSPSVWSGTIPLTPQQAAVWKKANALEDMGRRAQAANNYVAAAAAYRAETQVPRLRCPPWTWINLGLMLDYQGERQEAFQAYKKGFGTQMAGSNEPEAAARYGLMCEDAGLHAQACECYYGSRSNTYPEETKFLSLTLDAGRTSPTLARSLLEVALGIALDNKSQSWNPDKPQVSAEAVAAFRSAVKLAPDDPRPQFFLAYGLCHAGRFAAAEAALKKVPRLDPAGALKAPIAQMMSDAVTHQFTS